jgi:hypothetical protein
MFKRYFVMALFLIVAGCGKSAIDTDAAKVQIGIDGELSESSYNKAAAKVLAQARVVMADPGLTEEQLNASIAKIESVVELADQLKVEKAKLSEAELTSTLGSLYVRKAAFHSSQARQAGAFVAKGFRYLDRAITKYPSNITARVNRGIVSAKVPEFMHKTEVARDDLEFVLSSPDFSGLTPQLQASVKSMLGEMNRRLGQDAN